MFGKLDIPYFREQFPRKLFFFEFYLFGHSTYRCGNYSRAETIRGKMVFIQKSLSAICCHVTICMHISTKYVHACTVVRSLPTSLISNFQMLTLDELTLRSFASTIHSMPLTVMSPQNFKKQIEMKFFQSGTNFLLLTKMNKYIHLPST